MIKNPLSRAKEENEMFNQELTNVLTIDMETPLPPASKTELSNSPKTSPVPLLLKF
jgi:hypothetical protein